MAFDITLEQILGLLGDEAQTSGRYAGPLRGIASLSEAAEGDLSFLGNPKYRAEVAESRASVLLLPEDFDADPRPEQLLIRVQNPSFALARICREIELRQFPQPEPGVHPSAVVDPSAAVAPEASIGPLCVIGAGAQIGAAVLESQVSVGRGASIGDGSWVQAGVRIGAYCEIGPENRLMPGCVIGADGYGYEFVDGAHQRVPQIGRVVTGRAVDIGANTTIDRARFGATEIGAGTKIDNQVQIAHNVRIGKCCLIVAQVGISGSTRLGDGVVVAGQAGIAGHLEIGGGVQIAGGAAVTRSIAAGKKVRGSPAVDMMLHDRLVILQRKLPDLFKRFDQLEKTLKSPTAPG
ncbi:MAG: UDP-3-O-(3-hydroxymyristoyl)glucosamine N-acyltransferase [Opitutales bacterium]